MQPFCRDYLKSVKEIQKGGDETEGSYYPSVQSLFKSFAENELGISDAKALLLPQQVDIGAPDLRISRGDRLVGYVEVKDPRRVKTLVSLPDPDRKRFEKYQNAENMNIVLTNTLEFELYQDGKKIGETVFLANITASGIQKTVDGEEKLIDLLNRYFDFYLPQNYTPQRLAETLAKRARWLRDAVRDAKEKGDQTLITFYEGFRKYLISTLEPDAFDDLMAQTIIFGLLASRYKAPDGKFNRDSAWRYIPPTIGILKKLFIHISTEELPEAMEWVLGNLADILTVADVPKMFKDYYAGEADEDPIFYFYQRFLRVYEPEKSEQLGVYYTPEPVISFIVRSVNRLLTTDFDRPNGLADEKPVKVLDPAGGTLGFLSFVAKEMAKNYANQGSVQHWIKPRVLENLYGLEYMVAPYTLGHLKMSATLDELGAPMEPNERMKLYLTNTLEFHETNEGQINLMDPVIKEISEEAMAAEKVKGAETPILVVIGNPPYSGHSANPSKQRRQVEKGEVYYPASKKPPIAKKDGKYFLDWDATETKVIKGVAQPVPLVKRVSTEQREVEEYTWIGRLIQDYRIENGTWTQEKTDFINDDYVKFLRFAQWKVDQLGEGVIGFITGHGYLDNPTFVGMRQSLMQSFNKVYVLDLHGNTRKKEVCPDGSKDESVFDIMNGTAIVFLVKKRGSVGCEVYHQDLWGVRQSVDVNDLNTKYGWLRNHDVESAGWTRLKPVEPHYVFVPRDATYYEEYREFPSVQDIFVVGNIGVVTGRDNLTMSWTPDEMWDRVRDFASIEPEVARVKYNLGKDAINWRVARAQEDLNADGPVEDHVYPILYRPFDTRFTYYTGNSNAFYVSPANLVMPHMTQCTNLGLVTSRMTKGETFRHAQITNSMTEVICMSSKTSNNGFLFPLYLYDSTTREMRPNLSTGLLATLKDVYTREPTPEEVLYYVFAVLYSNMYREKYKEFLKSDFARVPFTSDRRTFGNVAKLGEKLANLHLLKDIHPVSRFTGKRQENSLVLEKIEWKKDMLFINDDQYFSDVPKEVWDYSIGGYQVLDKWLKERGNKKKRPDQSLWVKNALDEVSTFCKIIEALRQTIEVQKEIDKVYPEIESNLIDRG